MQLSFYTTPSKLPNLKSKAKFTRNMNTHTNTNSFMFEPCSLSSSIIVNNNSSSNIEEEQPTKVMDKVILKNALEYNVTTSIIQTTTHWDINDAEKEVEWKDQIKRYIYDSEAIPVHQNDLEV